MLSRRLISMKSKKQNLIVISKLIGFVMWICKCTGLDSQFHVHLKTDAELDMRIWVYKTSNCRVYQQFFFLRSSQFRLLQLYFIYFKLCFSLFLFFMSTVRIYLSLFIPMSLSLILWTQWAYYWYTKNFIKQMDPLTHSMNEIIGSPMESI